MDEKIKIEVRVCKCSICEKVFVPDWSEAEAIAEYEQRYGRKFNREECGTVCSVCYEKVTKHFAPMWN